MKKIISILMLMLLWSCNETFELNDNIQQLNVTFISNKYVAFRSAGAVVSTQPVEANEGETVSLFVETPTGSVSDVSVNYNFSGSAVYGSDFTIDGATSDGGSVIIIHDKDAPDDSNVYDYAVIKVNLLSDSIIDGDKQLIINLVSASSADGNILVGRGGTGFLKFQVVNISDMD